MSQATASPGRELAALLAGIGCFVAAFFGLTAYTGAGLASTRSDSSRLKSHMILCIATLAGVVAYKLVVGRGPASRSRRETRPAAPASPLWDRELD